MLGWILKKVFGSSNQRRIRKLMPLVEEVNLKEVEYQKLSEDELRGLTQKFRDRLAQGETLDDIMVEAFAAVKNACRRLCGRTITVCEHELGWDMVPFDVQILGGIVLHKGMIAEMATGEGKTLVATLPMYLNALSGKGTHLVTVNDYLARRDSQWMGAVYTYLGLSVGCLQNDMDNAARREVYACDIVYGTNSEFGFDYLRDNGQIRAEDKTQRGHNYAIIDEVDSILVDEARTPLIISGPVAVSTHKFDKVRPRVGDLVHKQSILCTRFLKEAKQFLEEGKDEEASVRLFQTKYSMPKNRQFLKMCEDPKVLKLIERFDLEIHTDLRKQELQNIYEEMFFVMDEKHNDVHITEKGRTELNPADLDEFVMPDALTAVQQVEADEELTEAGREERKRAIYAHAEETSEKVHNLTQLLKAYCLFEKDVDYVVQEGEVLIVDEFTGRLMPGRRYSDGLHQAIEAKEGVTIERETQTLATITIQNYFRMYKKLAGMTGTAETEADEFLEIYKLPVVVVPTNRPVRRDDYDDVVYKTRREKYNAVVEEIAQLHAQKRPVLVGTVSVETSELLSRLLKRQNIPHAVLNAKYHQKEAEIVALAGQAGAVTIATNMAGRGTDIKLGAGVADLGGLHVIGSERHEARRIDRQLRGRCARQGDPGSSRFYVSLEDDLMRLFGSDRIAGVMTKLGMKEGEELTHPLLSRNIEMAQRRVEKQNFHIRKHVLKYDDVMNKQREIIYGFRDEVLEADNLDEYVLDIVREVTQLKCDSYFPASTALIDYDLEGLRAWMKATFLVSFQATDEDLARREIAVSRVMDAVEEAYRLKSRYEGPERMQVLQRFTLLMIIDKHWKEHLYNMDGLRESVSLRAYGQSDPLIEYKKEAFTAFSELIAEIKEEYVRTLFQTSVVRGESYFGDGNTHYRHDDVGAFAGLAGGEGPQQGGMPGQEGGMPGAGQPDREATEPRGVTVRRDGAKVGRNDPCPCGSGKKYKKCCGQQQG